MWETVFDKMLSRLIRTGALRVIMPDGTTRLYAGRDGPEIVITIADHAMLRALCVRPDLALGEGYMDGRITIEADDLEGLLRLLMRNYSEEALPVWSRATERLRYGLRNWIHRNDPTRARANVAHHYDISDDLYRLFLDADMQYSCAYFTDPEMSLDAAQAAKKAHIATKLRIEPGMRVLDIGCGWGGTALTLARDYGARVTGITLSENQLATARARAHQEGLEDRIDFRLQDYRLISETFDRVVSVGMLEHVGPPQYDDYFSKVSALLGENGVALIHTIGRLETPVAQSEWLNRYIFPGGYTPSLSMLAGPIEDSGLITTDIEVLRLHYAMTIRHWLARFRAGIGWVRQHYDERFVRMWTYYLTSCIVAFEEQRQGVLQIQLARRLDTLPLTRDYLHDDDTRAQHRHAAE